MVPEMIKLRSRRSRPDRGLGKPLAGFAFLGLVISMIGWLNLLTTHRDHSFYADPFEWYFAVAGSLIAILSGLLLVTVRFGPDRPCVVLSAGGAAFSGGETLPWAAFDRLVEVHHPDGGRELIGSLAVALSEETRQGLAPYLVAGNLSDLGRLIGVHVAEPEVAGNQVRR
jgi:hypothetical protein